MKNIGIFGAKGMVGSTMHKVVKERNLPYGNLYLFDAEASEGILAFSPDVFEKYKLDIALFAVSGDFSREFAPAAVKAGCTVIDNSSAWRMEPDIPLIVPEVNADEIPENYTGIIANPNCSTIQAVVALNPLHKAYKIKRIVYSTYQSVSGAGNAGIADLERTAKGEAPRQFPYPIAGNVIPRIDLFNEDGYTLEEMKLVNETQKILKAPDIRVTATAVRVPVAVGHSESVNVTFENDFELSDIWRILGDAPGIVVNDEIAVDGYPTPKETAGTDMVYVGRIRRDFSEDNSLNMWVVADNVRKGAATNAVQIAEVILRGR